MLTTSAVLGYGLTALIHFVKPHFHQDHTCPWFIFLFGLGVWASIAASTKSDARTDRRWLWAISGAVIALAALLEARTLPSPGAALFAIPNTLPFLDALVGLFAACALVALTHNVPHWGVQASRKALSWKPLTFLGTFAYSLYLIHLPLINTLSAFLFAPSSPLASLPPLGRFFILVGTGVPAVLGIAYLFFLVFERPFLNVRQTESHAAP